MGGNQTLPVLPNDQLYYVQVGQNIEFIPYEIPPGHPVLSFNLQKNIIKYLPPGLFQLKTLILSENSLTEINDNLKAALLSYSSLQTLDLAKNKLSQFDIELEPLVNINLIQNRLTKMPPLSPNLTTVSLDFNIIKVIDKSSAVLNKLTMSLNYIDNLDDSVVLDKLEFFDFSMNRLSVITDFSRHFPVVQNVNLSYNMLKEFPTSLSESIVELDISGNDIQLVPEDIVKLTNITTLDISFNKITKIPVLPSSLKYITANNNKITEIANSELPQLFSMNFSNNELGTLPSLTNHICSTLFFSHNRIKEISLAMMIRPVEQLDLSDNEITNIPVEIFSLPRLRILNLDSNQIEVIPDQISESHISSLLISQNPIKQLPLLPKSLESLFAAYCQLTDISNAFTECTRLSKLSLSGNAIVQFESIPSLQVLSLSQCKLEAFPQISNRITSLDLSMNNIKEIPDTFSAPYLTSLDLSNNLITCIPDPSKFIRLVILKLNGNPIEGVLNLIKNESLNSINLYATRITQCNFLPKVREVLTHSQISQEPFRQIICRKSGYASTIGIKVVDEDSVCLRDDLNFYCICDGHNGSVTSTKVSNMLPLIIQQPHEFDGNYFNQVFSYIDNTLKEMNVRDGSTVICAEIRNSQIIAAHFGDARAIIVTNDGQTRALTKDHKPTVRKEFERIMHAGGRVVQKKTNGVLTISRSLGDFDVIGLNCEPEINHVIIDENDKYLIMACNGLFEVFTNDEVGKISFNCSSPNEAAYKLRNLAFARGAKDNVSVIVVPINV